MVIFKAIGRTLRAWSGKRFEHRKCPTSTGIEGPEHEGRYKTYKIVGLLAIPLLIAYNVYILLKRRACEEPRPEFHKYEYMYLRSKRFPWGDGNKSLFHNPKVNALPDGYEEIEEQENGDC